MSNRYRLTNNVKIVEVLFHYHYAYSTDQVSTCWPVIYLLGPTLLEDLQVERNRLDLLDVLLGLLQLLLLEFLVVVEVVEDDSHKEVEEDEGGDEVKKDEVEVDQQEPVVSAAHDLAVQLGPALLHHQLEHGLECLDRNKEVGGEVTG